MAIETINPSTGTRVQSYAPHAAAEIEARLARAAAAARVWRETRTADRARVVARAGAILDRDRERYARLMTLEMGKLVAAARDEAASAPPRAATTPSTPHSMLAAKHVAVEAGTARFVAFHPLGRRARRHAVELPLLAGLPFRRAGADGRQRGPAQARLATCRNARWPSRNSSAARAFRVARSRRC